MKGGGGKRKGSAFERQICKALSLWISGGKKTDIFWRSAMSGGRATFHKRKGIDIRQSGDITAVAPEGHVLTDNWFIECKNIRDMKLGAFLISNKGPLAKFWKVVQNQAANHHKEPMLIVRSRGPILVFTHYKAQISRYVGPMLRSHNRYCDVSSFTELMRYRWQS